MSLKRQRVAFYTHDSMGLGHLRRTLSISQELERCFDGLSTLIITGSAMAHGFRIPPGVDYVKLPSVRKVDNEVYESRFLSLPFEQVSALRKEIIFKTVVNYRPDFFFVDNVPLGLKGELLQTLRYIRDEMPATRVILNLRDIIDSASHVRPLWRQLGVFETLEEFYDRIFIYGQASIFDLIREYEFPQSLCEKSRFCGYIPRAVDKQSSDEVRRGLGLGKHERLILVTVGGGSDGGLIIENYLQSLPLVSKQHSLVSVVLLGPEMDERNAKRFAARGNTSSVRLLDFCDDALAYMDAADLVVSMGGYNTVSEILALGKRAIVIPRVCPRKEQFIRSQRLEELGLLRMIHPDALTPDGLAAEIKSLLRGNSPCTESALDFGGVRRLLNEVRLLDQENISEARQRFAKEAVL